MTVIVTVAFMVAVAPLISLLYTVVDRGLARFDSDFFTISMRGVVGAGGGAYHAILGTLIITGLATVISVPIGIMTAIYLQEYGGGRLRRWVTFFVDVMTGIPSIVAGLFAYALFAIFFGPGIRLGIIGAVALSVLMIPIVVRSTEEMLRIVPNHLREAAFALGVSKWRTIVKVVLPTAMAGIITGVMLAIARIIGETAPLLITTGVVTSVNGDPFNGRMSNLAVFAFNSVQVARRAARGVVRPGVVGRAHADPHRDGAEPARTPALPPLRHGPARMSATTERTKEMAVETAAKTVEAKDLNLYYGSFLAVKDVNVTLQPNKVTALIGSSGCGKSTFLRSHQPHARAGGRSTRRGRGLARRPGHLRRRRRPRCGPAPDRHGLPGAEPVPDDVDLRQRRRRPQAQQPQDEEARHGRGRREGRCAARTCGKRSRTGSASPAWGSPAASSSACASRGPRRSSPTSC